MSSLAAGVVQRPTPASLHRLFWVAVSALVGIVGFSFWGTIGKPDCMDLDFGSYYRAAEAVTAGQSPYFVDVHGPLGTYPYAPIFPFLLIPLGQLDYLWACRIWLLLNWLTLAACCALALRLVVERRDAGAVSGILFLVLVPTAAYVWATLRVGQVSLLMLLGCLAWAVCRRQDRCFLGGLFLATACALKLAPGVFVIYLIIRRDLRGLAGVAVGSALLFLAPALWVGTEGAINLHREWIDHTVATQVPVQTYRPGNQSLLGQLARLPAISNGHECYSEQNLEQLCALYPAIVLIAAIIVFGAIIWRRRLARRTDWRQETVELALLFTFLTLAQPRGWRCNFVAMLVPCLLLAEQVLSRGKHWKLALGALVCMLLACGLPTDGLSEVGWNPAVWLLQGKHFWGAVAVGAAAWWCNQATLLSPQCSGEKGLRKTVNSRIPLADQ